MTPNPNRSNAPNNPVRPAPRLGWREIFVLEAPGIRTALAATVPFILGQILKQPAVGLIIGLGGMYTSLLDKPGATLRTLLLGVVAIAAAALGGSLAGNSSPVVAVPLMFAVAFILGMGAVYGEAAANVGYVTALVFAVGQGLPAPLRGGLEHLAQFAGGGIWAVLLTLLLWRLRQRLGNVSAARKPETAMLRDHLTRASPLFRHGLRLAVASSIAVALFRGFRLEHGYWLILTVLVIVKPEYADTRKRIYERVFGSIAGGVLAIVLALLIHNTVALDLLLVFFAGLAFSHGPRNYGLYTLFLTPFVVLMINIVVPGDWQIALTRIYETIGGGVLAWIVSFALRPRDSGLPSS